MIKTSIEKLAHDVGWDIGNSNDEVQSDLLNGFCEAIHDSMQENKREIQICYIVNKLNKKSKLIITELHEFIKLKEKGE